MSALAAPSVEIANKRYVGASFVKANEGEGGKKVYSFKFTTASVDRDGEIITLDGWEFGDYLKNPVILDAHDYYSGIEAIVGHCTAIRRLNDGWECDVVFSDTPKGKLAQQLVEEGSLRAVSVGFRAKTIKREPNEPPRHMEKELLEISVVPIPSNRDALRTRGSAGPLLQNGYVAFDTTIPQNFGVWTSKWAYLGNPVSDSKVSFTNPAKDFNSQLAQSALDEDRWRYYHALSETLREIVESQTLTPDEQYSAAEASLAQFGIALLGVIRQAIGIAENGPESGEEYESAAPRSGDSVETKAGRTLSAKNEREIRSACDEILSGHKRLTSILDAMKPAEDDEPKSGEADQTAEVTPPETKGEEEIENPEPPTPEVEAPDTKDIAQEGESDTDEGHAEPLFAAKKLLVALGGTAA